MSIQNLEIELKALIQEREKIYARFKELNKEIDKCREALFVEKYGAKIGDTIEWDEPYRKRKGVIKSIEVMDENTGMYVVNLYNKDGRIGKRETHCWCGEKRTSNPKLVSQ